MSIRDEMMSGRLYDASNGELLGELLRTQELCQDYNALRITDLEGRTALLRKLIGKVGKNFIVNQPFFCDYGSNIEVGDDVFINAYCVILDEAKVTFGNTYSWLRSAASIRRGIHWTRIFGAASSSTRCPSPSAMTYGLAAWCA